MHHRIVSILRRLKQDPARHLDRPAIVELCRQIQHPWRTCLLDPVAMIHLFLLQILHGNTAINHLRRLAGATFTDGSVPEKWRLSGGCDSIARRSSRIQPP